MDGSVTDSLDGKVVRHPSAGCCAGFALGAALAILSLLLCGCVYKGAKITEGVDFSAGLSVPATEGAAQVSCVNYLSGFRFGVAENSGVECWFESTNTFSFAWGLYEGRAWKRFRAKVEPCEVGPKDGD